MGIFKFCESAGREIFGVDAIGLDVPKHYGVEPWGEKTEKEKQILAGTDDVTIPAYCLERPSSVCADCTGRIYHHGFGGIVLRETISQSWVNVIKQSGFPDRIIDF